MRALVLLCGLAVGLMARDLAARQTHAAVPHVESFRLKNGLRVHLEENHARPRVAIAVRYRVGLRDEPPGYVELPHLVEHLFYQGSANVPEDTFFPYLEQAGATDFNGFVSLDDTACFEELPSHSWPIALWLESDRMAYMLSHLNEQTLRIQREVVRNEWRQRGGHVPINERGRILGSLIFPEGHPYRLASRTLDPTGLLETADVDAIGTREVAWFFQRYYRPSNATLALVGDFSAPRARELIERYFGPIRSVGPGRPTRPTAVARRHTQETVSIYSPTIQGALVIGWPTPPLGTVDDAALDIIAGRLDALHGPLRGRLLAGKLVDELDVSQESHELASLFVIDAILSRTQLIDETLWFIDDALAQLPKWLDKRAVERERRRWIRKVLASAENTAARALHLSRHGAPIETEVQRYAVVDVATVQRVVRTYLASDRRVVLRFERNK